MIAGDETVENRSLMRFSTLPGGLNHYLHSRVGLIESGIDLFGTGTLVYWNSNFPNQDEVAAAEPDQIRLVSGRMFSGESAFTLEIANSGGDIVTDECRPLERVSAQTIHIKLLGNATIFQCKTSVGTNSRMWYLEDYARYITQSVYDDEGFLSRFTVKDVRFH